MIAAAPRSAHPPAGSPATKTRDRLWEVLYQAVRPPDGRTRRADARPRGYGVISNDMGHRIVREGVSGRVLVPLGELLDLGITQLAPVLGVDRTTARRYAQSDQELPSHSAETVLRLAELEALATDVFASEDAAHGWLKTSHPMLGESPIDAARTSYGAQRVREILTAIKYGGVA